MKKTLWLGLVLLMVCIFTFSACDNGDTPPNSDGGNNQQITEENENNNSGSENSNNPIGCQHTFGSWNTIKQATCKEEGKLVRTCSKCSETEESTVSKNNIHTEVVDAAVSATCTVDGKTEGKHCSICGKTIVEQTTVKASGHTEVVDPAVNATCEIEGKTEGKHCSVCDTVIVKQNSINIIDHVYQYGFCSMCKCVDTVTKQTEIDTENVRHQEEIDSIESFYSSTISALEQHINSLKSTYNISYTYETSYCRTLISDGVSEISRLERRISALSGSTNSGDIAERRKLESQLAEKRSEVEIYYKHIAINDCYIQIENYECEYQSRIERENETHIANLEYIDIKYKCYEDGHSVSIIAQTNPTCEENGLTAGVYCETCSKFVVDQEKILTSGHDINDVTGICDVCQSNIADIGFIFEWIEALNGYKLVEYLGNDTSVVIPSQYKGKDVIAIGTDVFNGCTHVLNIVVPESVVVINGSAFSGCSSLQSITLPFVGYGIIEDGDKYLTSTPPSTLTFGYIFGKSYYDGSVAVDSFGGNTFYVPKTLKSVTITGGNIFLRAFEDYDNIEYITLGENVRKIGALAFYDVSSLKEVNISDGIIEIDKGAFCDCNALISINVGKNNPNYQSIDGNLYSKDGKTLMKYADGKTEGIFVIPDGVTDIGYYAFNMMKNIVSITIPNSVTIIGTYAFQGCDKLVEVINQSAISFTKGSSDHGYIAQNALVIHNGQSKITNIDNYLFYTHGEANYLLGYVGNDTDLTLPNSYNGENYEIYHHAFFERADITSVIIPNSVTSIGQRAFCVCTGLISITIPDSVTTIGEVAFFKCSSLTSIHYGGLTSQWTTISKNSDWNDTSTGNCTVYCTNGELAKK